MINAKFGYHTSLQEQYLICGGRTLADYHMRIDSDIENSSLIQLKFSEYITITIKFISSTSILIGAATSDTIETIITRVLNAYPKLAVLSRNTALVFNGRQLKDSFRLAESDVRDKDVLFFPIHRPLDGHYQIFVRDQSSKSVTLTVRPSDSIISVKELIMSKTYIPVDQQRLQLEEFKTLTDYNIHDS